MLTIMTKSKWFGDSRTSLAGMRIAWRAREGNNAAENLRGYALPEMDWF
jgi:hypothetical protein